MNNTFYYFTIGGLITTALGYFIATFRKGTGEGANSVINLLQQEVNAQKLRLETTSLQVTQLNTQSLGLSAQLAEIKKDNDFFKKLISDALNLYLANQKDIIPDLQNRLNKRSL